MDGGVCARRLGVPLFFVFFLLLLLGGARVESDGARAGAALVKMVSVAVVVDDGAARRRTVNGTAAPPSARTVLPAARARMQLSFQNEGRAHDTLRHALWTLLIKLHRAGFMNVPDPPHARYTVITDYHQSQQAIIYSSHLFLPFSLLLLHFGRFLQ